MDEQIVIHGEQVPVITLTRRQLEEDWYTLHSQLQDRKMECESLKDEIRILEYNLDSRTREFEEKHDLITAQYNEVVKQNKDLQKEVKQLRSEAANAEQKLERIKEIANNIVQDCFYKDFECDDCDIKISCPFVCRKQILQIIESEEK